MQLYANTSSIPLSMAVFLATDNYDHIDEENYISATSLIKPLRQLILSSRVPKEQAQVDLGAMIASRMGQALHDGIERSWTGNYRNALKALGYPQRVIDQIRINPDRGTLKEDDIPVYLEQRAFKTVGKYRIGGKFDFVGQGRLEDFKSTSVYTAINNSKDEDYCLQGSIYRWLNPDIVTQDSMAIQFIFTDWSAAKARQDPGYPQKRTVERVIGLKSIAETDAFVRRKLALIEQYWDAPEDKIPECSASDLWRSEPIFKYYKNPDKRTRSTKNFETRQEANLRLAEDGHKGIVIERPGQVTACKYCAGFSVCTQKDRLIASGDLEMNT